MAILQILLILLLILLIGAASIHLVQIIHYGSAPFFPSKKEISQEILNNFECKDGDTVYELGCGMGVFLKTLRKNHPNKELKLVGVEHFILFLILLQAQNKIFRYNIEIRKGDLFQTDLSGADMIYCFLNVEAMQRLRPKILSECRSGALIFSYQFPLPEITPHQMINHTKRDNIFIYRI